MKKIICILFLFVLLCGTASADVGIGLKWFTESGIADEEATSCIQYGLYNPFSTNVTGYLTATRELSDLYSTPEGEKLVPAGTFAKDALMTQICFEIGDVYKEECMAGDFLCKLECKEKEVTYEGEVAASYRTGGAVGGTGSAVGTSMAAPLTLTVRCTPHPVDYTPLYMLIVGIIIIIILGFTGKKIRDRKPPEERKKEKIEKLQRKIEEMEKE